MLTMSRDVLVLNRNWCAVGVVPMQRAVNMLFSSYEDGEPKARIITPPPVGSYEVWEWSDWAGLMPAPDEDRLVGVSRGFKVPEVVILTRYEAIPIRKIHFCRRELWKRDCFQCQYCGVRPPNDECTIDHVLPKSLGGDTSWTNCVLSCYQCNSQKADRRPEDARKPKDKSRARKWRGPSPMKLLKEPVKPDYSILKGRVRILESWRHWLSEMYWEVTLENDMAEEVQTSMYSVGIRPISGSI